LKSLADFIADATVGLTRILRPECEFFERVKFGCGSVEVCLDFRLAFQFVGVYNSQLGDFRSGYFNSQSHVKTCISHLVFVSALIAGFILASAGRVTGQVYTNQYDFTEPYAPNYTNGDGSQPYGGVILSGSTLYGTVSFGGTNRNGTVFAVSTNGMQFQNLHNFAAFTFVNGIGINNEGASSFARLLLAGNTLYGTTDYGGTNGFGTVFAMDTDGSGFTNLYNFAPDSLSMSATPSGLALSGNTLYGTTTFGGTNGYGMIFAINTNGSGFMNLHDFDGFGGAYPHGDLILAGNTLYGTSERGGNSGSGYGTVFAIHTGGLGYTNLQVFNFTDGAYPYGGLILSGGTLYGTTTDGGGANDGTVFAISTNGMGFTNLHVFASSDGDVVHASLVLSGKTLYGTASEGGLGKGTVFAINTNGTGFAVLHAFTDTGNDAENPYGAVVYANNTLFGTAEGGGSSASGTVFSITLPLPPPLTIIAAGANAILTWPTNIVEFTLESTTNLDPQPVWTTVVPAPVVVGGLNTVTNPLTGTQMFYRLSQ
jgi:uncharacterized repeat protein (TIGR03803 family)